jgi:hypothetical protein
MLIKNKDAKRVNVNPMSDREFNQVLAALRHWQHSLPEVAEMERYSEYLEDGLTFMSAEEIDEFCERMNLGPLPEDPEQWPWMKGMDPAEADEYFGELQECKHCAGTDGKHHANCGYIASMDDEKTNYFDANGIVKKRL